MDLSSHPIARGMLGAIDAFDAERAETVLRREAGRVYTPCAAGPSSGIHSELLGEAVDAIKRVAEDGERIKGALDGAPGARETLALSAELKVMAFLRDLFASAGPDGAFCAPCVLKNGAPARCHSWIEIAERISSQTNCLLRALSEGIPVDGSGPADTVTLDVRVLMNMLRRSAKEAAEASAQLGCISAVLAKFARTLKHFPNIESRALYAIAGLNRHMTINRRADAFLGVVSAASESKWHDMLGPLNRAPMGAIHMLVEIAEAIITDPDAAGAVADELREVVESVDSSVAILRSMADTMEELAVFCLSPV